VIFTDVHGTGVKSNISEALYLKFYGPRYKCSYIHNTLQCKTDLELWKTWW